MTGPVAGGGGAVPPTVIAWSVIQTTAELSPGMPVNGPNTTRA